MSQKSDHFLLNPQRSLKHEFCVVVVCVLCACHDPIEVTVPEPCNFTPVPPTRLSSLGYFAPGLGAGLRTRLHFQSTTYHMAHRHLRNLSNRKGLQEIGCLCGMTSQRTY